MQVVRFWPASWTRRTDNHYWPLFTWAWRAALAVAVLVGAAAMTEHILERRDRARLFSHETFALVDGRHVRYRLTGTEHLAPVTVLITGLSGSIEQYRRVQDLLSGQAPVLAYDRVGMGVSDPIASHDVETQAAELEGLLRALQITRPIDLMSYSCSGLLARRFVDRNPGMVRSLVFIDPAVPDKTHVKNRTLVAMSFKALVGIMRVNMALASRGKPPEDEAEERGRAIDSSFSHWYATTLDMLLQDNWTNRFLAQPAMPRVPLGVYCSFDPDRDPDDRVPVEIDREFAAKSPLGFVRHTNTIHNRLMDNDQGAREVVQFIQEVQHGTPAGAPTVEQVAATQ